MSSPLNTGAQALGATATWGEDEQPEEVFEPINLRRYFPNRRSYRTRGRPQTLRRPRPLRLVSSIARSARPRQRRRQISRTTSSRGDPSPSEPEPPLG